MGRGRQKAKATKQARDIKYYSPSTDYAALQRELGVTEARASRTYPNAVVEPDYSDYEDKYEESLEDGDDETPRRTG